MLHLPSMCSGQDATVFTAVFTFTVCARADLSGSQSESWLEKGLVVRLLALS